MQEGSDRDDAAGVLTTLQAADVLGVSPRQMRRLRHRLEIFGEAGLMDGRAGLSRKKRVPEATVDEICRRKRERRPLVGMMLHLDASTHEWIAGLPRQDLVVMLDDADGRILYACFVEPEGTRSTLEAIAQVLRRHGRFCEPAGSTAPVPRAVRGPGEPRTADITNC